MKVTVRINFNYVYTQCSINGDIVLAIFSNVAKEVHINTKD